MKSRKLAGFLSLAFPGLGHLYAGRHADGVMFMLGAGVLWTVILIKSSYLWEMGVRGMIFWGGFIAVYLYALVDVVRKVNRK